MIKRLLSLRNAVLASIILFAAVVRIYSIGGIPPSLTWDEVSWGYNAYSLGIDGKDEFGVFLPYKYLESFGDFKPPLYAYLDIIPIKLFGLTEFAVRLPSAIFGTLTVLLAFFLTREIFFESKRRDLYAFTSTVLLAFSPWHINLSRAAFEANVSQFLIVLGVLSFLVAARKNMWFITISAFTFALSFYTFNTARIVSPLLVIILSVFLVRKLIRNPLPTIAGIVIGVAMLLPLVSFLLSPQASLRFREVNIFTDEKIVKTANQEIANDNNSILSKAIHNRRLKYSVSFISHYLDNLSPSFLFIKGDGNPKFSTRDVGQLYLWSLPFLIIGSVMLFRKREGKWWVIPLWLLLGIIPAATARETPHALRIETVLPTFQLLISYGFVSSYFFLKSHLNKMHFKIAIILIIAAYIVNVSYYFYGYYTHYSREQSGEWQYGYKEALEFANENEGNFQNIYFTTILGRPYAYYLFYGKINPEIFRKTATIERDAFGFVNVTKVGKYTFLSDSKMREEKNSLYVGQPINVPEKAKILKRINKLNGETALVIYTY